MATPMTPARATEARRTAAALTRCWLTGDHEGFDALFATTDDLGDVLAAAIALLGASAVALRPDDPGAVLDAMAGLR